MGNFNIFQNCLTSEGSNTFFKIDDKFETLEDVQKSLKEAGE